MTKVTNGHSILTFAIKFLNVLYKYLTCIQLLTACAESILCQIFVVLGEYQKFLRTIISGITICMYVCLYYNAKL